jgi:cytochrome P450
MVPGMSEELSTAVDETWGSDAQKWKDVVVFDTLMTIIPRVVNRMMVGVPLCRNQEFLSNMKSFVNDVIAAAMFVLRFTPRWLKPVVGRIVTIPNTYHWKKTAKFTLPVINERLANIKRKKEDSSFEWDEPNDYITWHINLAMAEDRQDELTPDMISRRIMPLNFAAIHTTTLTITNCLFDLISSDPSKQYLEGIREEAERILAEEGGKWTKAGLARCHRADSTIRESMRISNFMTRGVLRKVLKEEGIENKIEGWRAPKGAYVGLDVHSVQHDPEIYPVPETYDAFRFSRPKEKGDMSEADSDTKKGDDHLKSKNTDLITTSESFLPFGHGRHACPGRFFVSLELKMLLAYMVMNYEVEPLATRPPNTWFGQNNLPPFKAKIRVRRREGTGAK